MLKKVNYVYNALSYRLKCFTGYFGRFFYEIPHILSAEETLVQILENRTSVARFGDGEFKLILGKSLAFQEANPQLALRLEEVLKSNEPSIGIGIPDVFGKLEGMDSKAARFWYAYMADNRKRLLRMLNMDVAYYNSLMTRFWTGYRDVDNSKRLISLYKKIWEGRRVVFIEGELTRMGVGNDLFSEAASIERVLCPAINAWNSYDVILKTIKEHNFPVETLFIIALGPTATVLAYDLTKAGYQSLDLGHLDIQYEYYLRNASEKVAISGKYVNESLEGRLVSNDIVDVDYLDSIVAKIM